ncbi:uncharacterized protein METZ01_LOCUS222615 [marine metagenome]|mgnify:CR=1 FL=1|uniref:Uncharacterized protein n=1 Tax=marine metagenome TaxID=408172 RepID=A0A382G6G9_9ZZZZ|tara:strand:+ start:207 stop:455 length:249 start_codon:yes stop_codon:yes gene_type:complete
MSRYGITIKNASEGNRITLTCEHNGGIIYIVPSESSWVCSEENIGAHAITGFFEDLTSIESTQVTALMQKWGLYYRTLDVIK